MNDQKNDDEDGVGFAAGLLITACVGLLFAACGGFLYFWAVVLKYTVWSLIALVAAVAAVVTAIALPIAGRQKEADRKNRGDYWREVRQQENEQKK